MSVKKFLLIPFIFCAITFLPPASLYAKQRETAVAGSFYPKDKTLLKPMVLNYINSAKIESYKKPFALISPHAGYPYSGKVAGYAYNLLKHYENEFDTIVILGVNHHARDFMGNSVYKGNSYKTPLGEIKINQQITNALLKHYGIVFKEKVHIKEHSIETQIPFIQAVGDFEIVPLIIGDYSAKNCDFIADTLISEIVNKHKRVLFIASCDFSHYKDYDTANKMDKEALTLIKNQEIRKFSQKTYQTREIELCGYGPVMVLSMMAKKLGLTGIETLKYLNSGDTAGSKDHVVGYGAVAFYQNNSQKKGEKKMNNQSTLTKEDKQFLLSAARKSLTSYIKDNNINIIYFIKKMFLSISTKNISYTRIKPTAK